MGEEVTSKEYWDKYWTKDKVKYPNYDISRGLFYSYHMLVAEYINKTRERMGKKVLRVIDCGCGEGLILKFLYEQFEDLEIHGIEYSDSYYKAKSMAEHLGYQINIIKGDILDEWKPEYQNYFDIVISFGLIEHFTDPSKILAQMNQIQANGGCMITIIPNFDGTFNYLWRLYDRENYSYHVPIKKDTLVDLHMSLGLEDVSCFSLGSSTIPGLHNVSCLHEKMLRFLIGNINGRILRKIYPKQSSLERQYPMHPAKACAGFKSA